MPIIAPRAMSLASAYDNDMMFGRKPRLPVNIAFYLPVKDSFLKSHSQYVKNLKARLEESYQIATRNSEKVADRNKQHLFNINLWLQSKHNLAYKWESTMCKVLGKMGDLPAYNQWRWPHSDSTWGPLTPLW